MITYTYRQVLKDVINMIWPSENSFAKKMGLSQPYLNQIVNEQSSISPRLLKLLGYKRVKRNIYIRDVSYGIDQVLPHYYQHKLTELEAGGK